LDPVLDATCERTWLKFLETTPAPVYKTEDRIKLSNTAAVCVEVPNQSVPRPNKTTAVQRSGWAKALSTQGSWGGAEGLSNNTVWGNEGEKGGEGGGGGLRAIRGQVCGSK